MINWYNKEFFNNVIAPKDALIGIQNVFTPVYEIEKATGFSFIDAVPADAKEICVLFNTEFIIYFLNSNYIKDNNIKLIYGYDSDIDKKVVIQAFKESNYNNYELLDLTEFSNTKDIKDLIKSMGQRKFDVVFSNPPYNNNLDLKILELIKDMSNEIIFVHPASWILSKFSDSPRYQRIRNYFKNHVKYVNLFWGNDLFNIRVKNALAITHIVKSNIDLTTVDDNLIIKNHKDKTTYIEKFENITWHGSMFKQAWKEFEKFRNTVDIYSNVISHTCSEQDVEEFGYQIGKATGDDLPQWWDIYFILNLNKHKSFRNKNSKYNEWKKFIWSFNSSNEQLNFDNYLKTKFIRFYLSFFKTNIDLSSCKIFERLPWLDFTQSWNDAKLCKEFNISKELWQYIDKFIPDYYDDYESGF